MLVPAFLVLALQAPAIVGVTAPDAGADWFGIEVAVAGNPGAVVAYVSVPGEPAARIVPLGETDTGIWAGIVPVAPLRAIGIEVEALFADGSVAASGPHALGSLGLPDAVFGVTEVSSEEPPPSRDAKLLWIGAVSAAAALTLAVAGVFLRRTREDG